MDALPLGIGRLVALAASAVVHAGMLFAAGLTLAPTRAQGGDAAPPSRLLFVHLPTQAAGGNPDSTVQRVVDPPLRPASRSSDDGRLREPLAALTLPRGVPVQAADDGAPRESPMAAAATAPAHTVDRTAGRAEKPAAGREARPPDATAVAYLVTPVPEYPPRAREEELEGLVVLRVRVTREGTPAEIRIASSSGPPGLDHAAESAVARWTFRPARQGDETVESWMEVPIRFQLGRG
jgi:protein TonB